MRIFVTRCFQINYNERRAGTSCVFGWIGTPVWIFRGQALEFDPGFQYFRPGHNIQRSVADFEAGFENFSPGLNIQRRASKIWNRGMKNSNGARNFCNRWHRLRPTVVFGPRMRPTIYLRFCGAKYFLLKDHVRRKKYTYAGTFK